MKTTAPLRFTIFFLVIGFIGIGVWAWWHDAVGVVDPQNSELVTFRINKGESIKSIASRLSQERFIRSSTAFYILIKQMGIERDIQAGDFRLSQSMTARDVAEELTHGIIDIWVTVPEGWRIEEIANRLAKEVDIPESQFLQVAQEGYMFPDTYLIPKDATAGGVAQIMRENFDKKVTPEMRKSALDNGLTVDQVVTLASIVEREGRTHEDRPVIAGILLRRLAAGWPLQTDASLQYILGYQPQEKTWWKKTLTSDDKDIVSPYNTYKNTGMPGDPISNPGLASIQAVIYPKESEYWYYLHDAEGEVHYGRTLEEHNANIDQYLR